LLLDAIQRIGALKRYFVSLCYLYKLTARTPRALATQRRFLC